MLNLVFRSALVLALLFGLLFAVGMGAVVYLDLPVIYGVFFALGMLFLQYLLGPWILQLIYRIEWRDAESVDPSLARFISEACAARGIPQPRFGIIHDGNPNAFTFGHYPGDARLVVTSGLLRVLGDAERKAVVAHELGHIAHWDFVVMTVAAAVPLLLYVVYIATRSAGRGRRGKGGGYVALIGIASFVAYLVSHYIVLLLSRVREFYADQFAGEVTGDPGSLSTALVKVAYGLASAPAGEKKDDARMYAARALGIFDPKVAQVLALSGAGGGAVSADGMVSAMRWDLWNPWAMIYELASSPPLPAKRIRALQRQAQTYGRAEQFSFPSERPESYWDEFLTDAFFYYLPTLAGLAGVGLAAAALFSLGWTFGAAGLFFIMLGVAWWVRRWFSYRPSFREERTVRSLIGEVKVSAVRSVPATIEGTIIGRGIPGLFFSEDLVLQDSTGFIILDYRQPLRILEFFFGWVKAESLIGKRGKATGWYRRSPRPYFEMRQLVLEDGERVTSYVYPLGQLLIYAAVLFGALLLALEFLALL